MRWVASLALAIAVCGSACAQENQEKQEASTITDGNVSGLERLQNEAGLTDEQKANTEQLFQKM